MWNYIFFLFIMYSIHEIQNIISYINNEKLTYNKYYD